jgi:hypothetical protein
MDSRIRVLDIFFSRVDDYIVTPQCSVTLFEFLKSNNVVPFPMLNILEIAQQLF